MIAELPINWNNIPFAPSRSPIFYGWAIVVTSTLALLASIPGQTMGVGVFTDQLINSLQLTRTQLSTAYMLGTIASSLMLPYAGILIDRFGSRVVMMVAAIGLGLSVITLSYSDYIACWAANDSYIAAMSVAFVCFMCMRFTGQGCLAMVSRVSIGKWFNHRRGLATAISGVFVAFGFSASPRPLNALVQALGWRNACLVLALAVGLGMALLAWLFHRDNPEACGLTMDGNGDESWHKKQAARVPETRQEFTREQALKNIAFWAFSLGTGLQAFVITGLTFHMSSIGAEMGFTRAQSYEIFLPMSAFTVSVNFLGGWISDRMKLKWLLLLMMLAQGAGSAGMLSFGEPIGWWLLVVGYGVSGGLFNVLVTVTWPRFFGRKHLGAISGMNMSIMVFASAIAPALFAKLHATTGSYQAVTVICWSLPVFVCLLALRAENPQDNIVCDAP